MHASRVATPSQDEQAAGGFAAALRRIAEADSSAAFEAAVAEVRSLADSGDAQATAMLATLEAVGAPRPRDWSRALDYLVLAAERGSERARAQLRLMARTSAPGEDWPALRARIDVARLLQPPPAQALSERPRLRVFESFATADECRWLIERGRPRLQPAVVWDMDSGQTIVDSYRSNSVFELPLHETDVVVALIRARIAAATRVPEFIFELPQLMRYAVGEEFRPHHDFIDPAKPGFAAELARRGQRMGTFLLYLNEDFTGGETEFPKAGISFRGRTGDALFFANVTPDGRPDPLTLHAGKPPSSGEKWILSQWIRDRPPAG